MNLPMICLYGIPNCDTVKRARAWLTENRIKYEFHDYKKSGIDETTLRRWIAQTGWEVLLNRNGMMWRKVPTKVKETIDETSAIGLMLETPSIIKRPVLVADTHIEVGFDPEQYAAVFKV